MLLGVAIPVLVLEVGIFAFAIILEQYTWLLYLPISHVALLLITRHDAYLLSNIFIWISLTRTRTRRFWKMNSYAP